MYNSLGLFFFGTSAARWWRLECKRLFLPFAKSVTEKNKSRVDCAEADKKTVQAPPRQAQRSVKSADLEIRGGDFWRLGILPCGAARNLFTGKA
jgi:hypothetical protein